MKKKEKDLAEIKYKVSTGQEKKKPANRRNAREE